MHRAARLIVPLLTASAALVVAGCGSDNKSSSSSSNATPAAKKAGSVGVLLPDSKSSVRWETVDRPFLKKAFDDAGVKVIDYDRLTLKGSAAYYVSFDNVKVGELQGQGLVDCLGSSGTPNIAELNGSPTDNNATLFKQGYDSVLKPLYTAGKAKKVADQSVPDWDNQQALTIFEQMLQKTNNKIDGVLAANDGLGNSVISALKARKLKQIPVTGQDATPQGIQNILSGDQCMTVYKAVKKEADAASKLAIALATGKQPEAGLVNGKTNDSAKDVPSVLLTPEAITKDNIKVVFDDGFLKKTDVCTGKYASLCTDAGL
jgi:D-xylose transport system substrate-binding protein